MVRSHGGWAEIKRSADLVKGDERVLGDTSFVMGILADAHEKLNKRIRMKQSGVTLDRVEKRVMELFSTSKELYGEGRHRPISQARSLFCFWAVRELGLPRKELSERFSLSEPAVAYAVRRGQRIAEENGYKLWEG